VRRGRCAAAGNRPTGTAGLYPGRSSIVDRTIRSACTIRMSAMRRLLASTSALLVALFALTIPACDPKDEPPPNIPPPPRPRQSSLDSVYVEGNTFRDGRGRQLLFRGYNAKVNGIFDVTFEDGRKPNYVFPSLDEAGVARMEELGFDVIRLTINWSALEPKPKQYPEAFFAKVDAVLSWARTHRIYVLMDMHQDGYSKEIGEDGAPLWAITPPPATLLEGPSDDSRRLTGPVIKAGTNFFDDVPAQDGRPLQQAFVEAVQQIAKRYAGDPTVLGYEAFNEPVLFSNEKLDAFHVRFAEAIHAIDPDAPVLFEPIGTRNQWDTAAVPAAPWSSGPGVYAPHIYTGQFSIPSQNGWESEDPSVLFQSMQNAHDEAAAWATPLFVTEFGCDVSVPRGPKWFAAELDLQDRFLASSTAWAWEPGGWGFREDASIPPKGRPELAFVVSRPYPRAVAGDLLAIERPAPGHLRVRYRATARTKGLPHEVSASADHFTDVRFTCDGAPVEPRLAKGRAEVTCVANDEGEHVFEVLGTVVRTGS
jgi:endoglycosylceramidase